MSIVLKEESRQHEPGQEAAIHRLIVHDYAAKLYLSFPALLPWQPIPFERDGTTYSIVTGNFNERKLIAKIADGDGDKYEALEISEQEAAQLQDYCYRQLYQTYAQDDRVLQPQVEEDPPNDQAHTEQEYQDLLQRVERFEQRYQCRLDDMLNDKTPPTKVPFAVYQKLQQRFDLLKKGPYKPAERLVIDELQYQLDHPQKVDRDGFARINYETAAKHINMSSSTPKRTIRAILEQTPTYPLKCKWDVPEVTQDGRKIECLYAKATVTNLVAASMTLEPELEHKRKQGGNQYQCQNPTCLSTNVRKDSQIVCLDCGHISHLESTYPNGKLKNTTGISVKSKLLLTDMPVHTANTTFSDEQPPAENFLSNDTQPVGMVITSDPPYDADRLTAIAVEFEPEFDRNEIEEAAALLLAVAGDDENHIEMSRTGEKKYYTAKPPRPLELSDLVDHLRAGQARGASCSRRDGTTRGLCFDTDDSEEWKEWKLAARKLVQAGYIVILDESPAGRGGHLWILFDGLVNAVAARAAVLQIAPELAECEEYWPAPADAKNWNRVRLPGGFYARYGRYVEQPVKAWCSLSNVATGWIAEDGRSAAKLLLSSLTPASIVPALPSIDAEFASEIDTQDEQVQACIVEEQNTAGRAAPLRNNDEAPTIAISEVDPLSNSDPEVDARWIADHGPVETTTLWFAITDTYSAAWYNEHHPLEEIQPLERNNMALSPNGDERTASTNYRETAQGERWTDFSTHGRRPDGRHESGDALELAARVQGRRKGALLGENTREIVSQARAALESAAAASQPLPGWLETIITRAGRREYARLLALACKQTVIPASVANDRQVEQPPASVTIYVDEINTHDTPLPYKKWCHIAVDGPIEQLHAFARRLGLKAEWFQNKPNHPHYDLTPSKRAQALKLGAVPVSTLELIKRCYPVLHAIASSQQGEQLQPAPAAPVLQQEHDQGEQHGGQAEPREPQPLARGMHVNTPVGLATVETVRYLEAEQRWRCSVWTDDSHYAQLYVSEVEIVQQGRLL